MRKLASIAIAVAALTALPAVEAGAAGRGKARLSTFRSCAHLVDYARTYALRVGGPDGIPRRFALPVTGAPPLVIEDGSREQAVPAPQSAPVAGTDYSGTNVQEQGVDEPDAVKTDGKRLFVASGGRLHVLDVGAGAPRLLGSLALEGYGHELLLAGNRVLVLSTFYAPAAAGAEPDRAIAASSVPYSGQPVARLEEVDVSDPAAMRSLNSLELPGAYLSARLSGKSARVVVSSAPGPIALDEGDEDPRLRYRRAVRSTPLRTWRPTSVLEDERTGRRKRRGVVACRQVRRPATFSGLGTLTVLTIDLAKGLPAVDSDALETDGQTVYASKDSLFVASERWASPTATPERFPQGRNTAVHRFDISDSDSTSYRSSGEVSGYLLNQFSLSEHKGYLRAATTDEPQWWSGSSQGESESSVSVLAERDGALVQVGRVAGLGKGERIYAVRFIEDTGYVVTFRQTDPLYTLDLSDPRAPKVLGELKILGYSSYLHPVAGDKLLGIGQDATEQGRRTGTQLSLFDVSDLRKPVRLQHRPLGSGSSSAAEYDHHAFLWWEPAKLAVVPLQVYDGGRDSFNGAIGFRVDAADGIAEAGRVAHEGGAYDPPIERSLVVGSRLYTVSAAGVRASELSGFADAGWAPFPAGE